MPTFSNGSTALSSTAFSRLMSFDDISAQMTVNEDFVFGSSATPSAGQTKIGSVSDLSAFFNAFSDSAGIVSINSEMQQYQPFNAATHSFQADRLNLTALIDRSGGFAGNFISTVRESAVVTVPGTVSITNLGWTDTSNVQIGQLVVFQNQIGLYVVTAFTGSSVTLAAVPGAPGGTFTGKLNMLLPCFAATATATATDANGNINQIQFGANLPASVVVGMAVGTWSYNTLIRSNDRRITAISGGTITFSPRLALYTGDFAAGNTIIFMPPLISGQIWTRNQYDLCRDDAVWGFDADIIVPTDSSGGYDTRGVQTAAAFASVPTDYPWGAWPAFWVYSARNGLGGVTDNSEIDFIEQWFHTANGPRMYLGADHSPLSVNTVFAKTSGDGWTSSGGGFLIPPYSLSGFRRISCLVTPRGVLRFIDGECVQETDLRWTASGFAQVGFDLAAGSFSTSFLPYLLAPMTVAGLGQTKMGIKRLRTYVSAKSPQVSALNLLTGTALASVSVGGSLPSAWNLAPAGLAWSIVDKGIDILTGAPFFSIRMYGTAAASIYPKVTFDQVAVSLSDRLVFQCQLSLVTTTGNPPNYVGSVIDLLDVSGNYIKTIGANSYIDIRAGTRKIGGRGVVTDVGIAKAQPGFIFQIDGGPVDFTFRVIAPQLEKSVVPHAFSPT